MNRGVMYTYNLLNFTAIAVWIKLQMPNQASDQTRRVTAFYMPIIVSHMKSKMLIAVS